MKTSLSVNTSVRYTICPRILFAAFLGMAVFGFSLDAFGTLLNPGTSGSPNSITAPGGETLLGSLSGTFLSSTGDISGSFATAVYSNPNNEFGAGDLDFIYQVKNNSSSLDAINRITAINFTGFQTDVAFILNGSLLPGGLFANGTVGPQLVDRSAAGDTIGFTYNAPTTNPIAPGSTGFALIIETNAKFFQPGDFNLIDGGVTTINGFAPSLSQSVPDVGSTILLLGLGLGGLGAAGVKLNNRKLSRC